MAMDAGVNDNDLLNDGPDLLSDLRNMDYRAA